MTEQEEWRSIPGTLGYQASSLGRVRSSTREVMTGRGPKVYRSRVLRQTITAGRPVGYLRVAVKYEDGFRTRRVHALVLEAFRGPRPSNQECRHLNGDPFDNRLDNLSWATRRANRLDVVQHGNDHNARKTHCPRGHAYDASNTYRQKSGGRLCRKCQVIHHATSRAKKASTSNV